MTTPKIVVELNQVQLDKAIKRVERWRGEPLKKRLGKGTIKAATFMVKPMRAKVGTKYRKARRPGDRPAGLLKRSIKARAERRGIGAFVGPTGKAPHRFLHIRGTEGHWLGRHGTRAKSEGGGFIRGQFGGTGKGKKDYIVFPDGGVRRAERLWHPGHAANPFVDETQQEHKADALRIVSGILFGEG